MRILVAILALAGMIAVPGAGTAKTKHQHPGVHGHHRQVPLASYGYAGRSAHSPNPAWDVYRTDGEYAGSDPDPLVRMMLRKDDFTHDQ